MTEMANNVIIRLYGFCELTFLLAKLARNYIIITIVFVIGMGILKHLMGTLPYSEKMIINFTFGAIIIAIGFVLTIFLIAMATDSGLRNLYISAHNRNDISQFNQKLVDALRKK